MSSGPNEIYPAILIDAHAMLLIGGQAPDGRASTALWRRSFGEKTWQRYELPVGLRRPCAWRCGEQIVVAGAEERESWLVRLAPATFEPLSAEVSSWPPTRTLHADATGQMYAFVEAPPAMVDPASMLQGVIRIDPPNNYLTWVTLRDGTLLAWQNCGADERRDGKPYAAIYRLDGVRWVRIGSVATGGAGLTEAAVERADGTLVLLTTNGDLLLFDPQQGTLLQRIVLDEDKAQAFFAGASMTELADETIVVVRSEVALRVDLYTCAVTPLVAPRIPRIGGAAVRDGSSLWLIGGVGRDKAPAPPERYAIAAGFGRPPRRPAGLSARYPEPPLSPDIGRMVRLRGRYEGMTGLIERVEGKTLTVTISLFGASVRVSVDREQVSWVEHDDFAPAAQPPATQSPATQSPAAQSRTPPVTAREHPALEAALCERPEDTERWRVYGDWLLEQGCVRGEIIALEAEMMNAQGRGFQQLRQRIDAIIEAHAVDWLGPLWSAAMRLEGAGESFSLSLSHGFITEASLSLPWGSTLDASELLAELLANPAARFLQRLQLGRFGENASYSYAPALDAMVRPMPALRALSLGDLHKDQISWVEIGDLDRLWSAAPRLSSLKAHGGGIHLHHLAHDALEVLILESGGLPASSARGIAAGQAPSLTMLEVWFGSPHYGGDASVEDLSALWAHTGYPSLVHLGLRNCAFADDLASALAEAPIARTLQTLDLSMGTLTDAGAHALAQAKGHLSGLRALDIEDNFVGPEGLSELQRAFGGVLRAGHQRRPEFDRDPMPYVMVGE